MWNNTNGEVAFEPDEGSDLNFHANGNHEALVSHNADPLSVHQAASPWHVGAPQCVLWFLFSKSKS